MLLVFSLIFMHILGDFYFQPKKIADNKIGKNKIWPNFKWLLVHIGIYTVFFIPVIWLVEAWYGLVVIGIVFVSHFLIDGITCFLKKKLDIQSLVFLIDQGLHIIVLIVVGYLIYKWDFLPWNWLDKYQEQFEIAVCVLLIMKPSVIFIDIISSDIDFNRSQNCVDNSSEASETTEKSDETIQKIKNKKLDSGRVIGVAERLIAFVLILANAYAAIAIIITVKTWARQKEIQSKEGFGNKYLVGTLVSLTIAISIGFICANYIL